MVFINLSTVFIDFSCCASISHSFHISTLFIDFVMFGIDFSMNFISLSMVSIDFLMCFIDVLMIFTNFFLVFIFVRNLSSVLCFPGKITEEKQQKNREKTNQKKNASARKSREDRKVRSLKRLVRSLRDEKLHAVVARNTFGHQNVENTPCLDNFWKLRCRKSACRCGAKHISKSKCKIYTNVGPLLGAEVSPLWREAHVQVKISKYTMRQKLTVFDHFGTFTCCLMWQVQGIL